MLSRVLEQTIHHALSLASKRRHEYATLEHLLLALAHDTDAATVLRACDVDLDRLRADLTEFLDKDLAELATDKPDDPKPTAGFQRTVQRAVIHVQSSGGDEVTGANVLISLFSERESHAVYFLQLQEITRLDAVNFIRYGVTKARGGVVTPSAVGGRHAESDGQTPQTDVRTVSPVPPNAPSPPLDRASNQPAAQAQPAVISGLTTVFISYSHKDRILVDRLQVHLRPMERDGIIQRWDDRRISPGQDWREEIRKAIETARVAILIVSADFLASEFIARNELPPLLQLAKDRGTHILPILASPSRFTNTPSLSQFQAFNPPSRPLSAMNRTQRETLLVSVADRVEQLLQDR
jgi:hypothetical protein